MKASLGPDKQKVNNKMNKGTPVTQTKQIEGLQCQQFLATVWLQIMVVTLNLLAFRFWNNLALDVRATLSGEVKRRDRFIKFRVTVLVYPDITRASRLLCYVLKIHLLLLLLLLLLIASLLRYNGTSSSEVTPGWTSRVVYEFSKKEKRRLEITL